MTMTGAAQWVTTSRKNSMERGFPVTALGQFTIPDHYKHPTLAIAALCR